LIKSLGASTAVAALGPLAAPPVLAQAKRPVVYWGHNYPTRVQIVNEIMVPGFKAATGIDVHHEDFETNQNEVKILTSWTGGGDSGPDMVSVGDNNLPNYIYRKLVDPVDPEPFGFKTQKELIDAFEPGVLDGFMKDGVLYAIPMDLASISMYYRRDFFEEAGLDPDKPPTTWDEVMSMGKKLVKRDANGHITRAGWAWEARSFSSHFYYWGTLLPQHGVDFLNADGTANGFNNDQGMAAFKVLYDTFNGPNQVSALGLAPTISPVDDFGAGRIAMLNSGLWLAPSVEASYPKVTFKDKIYGVARLPQTVGGKKATRLNPWVYVVHAGSPVKKEAWQFIAYMTQRPEARDIWFQKAQYVLPWKGFEQSAAVKASPYASIFLQDLAIGVPTPRTPHFAQLAQAAANAYDRISANGEKPDAVVPDFANAVDNLLMG